MPALLMLLALVPRVIGFLKNTVIASLFGSSHISDTYLLLNFPTETILAYTINTTIITTLITFYAGKEKDKENGFWQSLRVYQGILMAAGLFIMILLVSFGAKLTPIELVGSTFAGYLYGISTVIQGFVNYKQKYTLSAVQDTLSQGILLVGIFLSAKYGINIFVISYVISGLTRIIVQLPDLKQYVPEVLTIEGLIKLCVNVPTINQKLLKMIAPVVISFIQSSIPQFFILFFLQVAGAGMLSAFNYANKIIALFNPIVVIPIMTYAVPKLIRVVSDNNARFISVTKYLLGGVFAVSLLIAGISSIFSEQIIRIVYMRGEFDVSALLSTTQFMSILSWAIVGYAVMYVLLQIALVINKQKLVLVAYTINSITMIITLIQFYIPLTQRIGLALILGTLISCIILYYGIYGKPIKFQEKSVNS